MTKQGLGERVGRIISGGINALVDAMESMAPETVMEQTLREIDDAIEDVRAELGRQTAGRHLALGRLADERRRHQTLAEQIAVAVGEERDDLAEAGIAEQLDIEAQIPVLERAIAATAEREQELEGYIQALQAKRRDMKAELARFAASRREAAAVGATATGGVGAQADGLAEKVARAERAFDRIIERQTGLATERQERPPQSAARLAELEGLARRNRIQERLAALKADRG